VSSLHRFFFLSKPRFPLHTTQCYRTQGVRRRRRARSPYHSARRSRASDEPHNHLTPARHSNAATRLCASPAQQVCSSCQAGQTEVKAASACYRRNCRVGTSRQRGGWQATSQQPPCRSCWAAARASPWPRLERAAWPSAWSLSSQSRAMLGGHAHGLQQASVHREETMRNGRPLLEQQDKKRKEGGRGERGRTRGAAIPRACSGDNTARALAARDRCCATPGLARLRRQGVVGKQHGAVHRVLSKKASCQGRKRYSVSAWAGPVQGRAGRGWVGG
jgi:hypothetical protein